MNVTESLVNLFNEWEIHLLVLVSFTLQLFLFFTGGLRRYNTSGFLRLSIWAAYLGADMVAVYALGLLSRHEDVTTGRHIQRRTESLAFFWAPFLVVHLGGQDTITSFAMEDNNLWLRHLLNLVVQVGLALNVFWKSIGRHNVELLVSGVFAFVAGIIKYGERIWSLKCGSLKDLESSSGDHYKKQLPEGVSGGDLGVVCAALRSMPYVLGVFAARRRYGANPLSEETLRDLDKMLKVVRIELGAMYDDLYTKTLVLRTRSVIIVRCISQISVVLAVALFYLDDKRRYRKPDIVISYSLFIGGFFLELCAIFICMTSPWTWAALKAGKCDMLARMSWLIFSNDVGLAEKKQRWPSSMGQYNLVRWLTGSIPKPSNLTQRLMNLLRWLLVDLVGVKKESIFWISRMLDTENVDVDKIMMECIAKEILVLHDESFRAAPRQEVHLWPILREMKYILTVDFGRAILKMHVVTEVHLSKYPSSASPFGMVDVCRRLSNYMVYLLVNQPSLLPLAVGAADTMERYQEPQMIEDQTRQNDCPLEPSKEALEELVHMWTRFLLYAAGKSRGELHAAQLSKGGELITFAWLLMAHNGLGDSQRRRIEITNRDTVSAWNAIEGYALCISAQGSSAEANSRV